MTEQEINQICDKCNQYIREHYQGKAITYAQMSHFTADEKTMMLNPGCQKETSHLFIMEDSIKVEAAVVYRRNGTSANTSIRVGVRHTCKDFTTCIAGIKFSASLKWPTIQKKIDSMIKAAVDSHGLICMPADKVMPLHVTRYTQDAATAIKFVEEHMDTMCRFSGTPEECAGKHIEKIRQRLGGGNG